MTDIALGVDVGGTHLRVAKLDREGNIHRAVRYHLSDRSPEALLGLMEKGRSELGVAARERVPMGVGLAAQIWLEDGVVAVAPNLGWRDVPFGAMLRERFSPSVRMVNDMNAITVGEAIRGAGEGTGDVMCVFVGTGVGMGAVVGGKIMEGADGLATELGHIKIKSNRGDARGNQLEARRCGCGESGCLEAYTSGRHLPELLREKVAAGVASPWLASLSGGDQEITAGRIDAAATNHDAAAMALWDDIADALACAIGNAVTLFNPRVLILGGGVLMAAPGLKTRLQTTLKQYTAVPAQKRLQVRESALGDDAGVIGAALIAHHDRKL